MGQSGQADPVQILPIYDLAPIVTRKQVLQIIASSRGGGAVHVRDLTLGLDRARFAVQVAMPQDGGNVSPADFADAGVPFHTLSISGGLSVGAIRQLSEFMCDVDLVHVHGARAALFGRTAARLLGRKRPRVVYTIHGFAAPHYPEPRRTVLLTVERALAGVTDRFIAVSRAERDALVDAGVAQPEQIEVVLNGIHLDRYRHVEVDREAVRRSLGALTGSFLITMVCRLFKPRDFDTLLEAAAIAVQTHPEIHLLIAGDGPLRTEVEARIASLSLHDHVTLCSWRSDLPEIYAASDLFVLTTWGWEGLPLTIVEAMASGLPVVATRAGGIPELVTDGETGLLVEPQDAKPLAAALERLVRDAELRNAMGAAARARAQHFGVERMVRATEAVYANLLKTQPAASSDVQHRRESR